MLVELSIHCAQLVKMQSSRKSVGPPDMSGKIVSGQVTIPRPGLNVRCDFRAKNLADHLKV